MRPRRASRRQGPAGSARRAPATRPPFWGRAPKRLGSLGLTSIGFFDPHDAGPDAASARGGSRFFEANLEAVTAPINEQEQVAGDRVLRKGRGHQAGECVEAFAQTGGRSVEEHSDWMREAGHLETPE
jgi:hypothetical protein